MQFLTVFSRAMAAVLCFATVSIRADEACEAPLSDIFVSTDNSNCIRETGFFITSLQPPPADQFPRVCANQACRNTIQRLRDEIPYDCEFFRARIWEKMITPLVDTCLGGGPPVDDSCGNDQVGATSCPTGQYCQPWNPTSYQCRRMEAKCGLQETGVDYYGDDLATLQLLLPEDCCNACFSTRGCTGYTFVNSNPDGKAYCYLKKGPGTKTSSRGAVSATVIPASVLCSRQLPYDLYGNDLSAVYGVSSADDCCVKCLGTTGCKAYTYVPSGTACYLKSSASGATSGQGLISGIIE